MAEIKRTRLTVAERKLGREKADGLYWPDDRKIEIDPRQPPKEHIDTLVHEALHDGLPKLSEKRINKISRLVSRVLWKQGYRKVVGV